MYFGEDKKKVSNIVKPNLAEFRSLYRTHLQEMGVHPENGVIFKVSLFMYL